MQTTPRDSRQAHWLAAAAIVLWGTLAWLGVQLAALPPFLLVGSALTLAGVLALPGWRRWRVPGRVLALGIFGLFGFHFFLFLALRLAPPLEANLINYLWPLLIVIGTPLFLPGTALRWTHWAGALAGLAGAALVILGAATGAPSDSGPNALLGCTCAAVSAVIWAVYSLGCRRLRERGVVFASAAVGLFCLVSGLLALACHSFFEPAYQWHRQDVLPLVALAVGPMGAAFFLWDAALARGDPRTIGSMAYATPLLSTLLLAATGHGHWGASTLVALLLIVGGAWLAARRQAPASRPDAAVL